MDSIDISRRRTLTALGATGALALAGCVGDDDDGADDGEANGTTEGDDFDGLRVGILGDLSETNPDFGYLTITGFLGGLAYKDSPDSVPATNPALDITEGVGLAELDEQTLDYTVDDTEFEIHIRNTQDSARPAGRKAHELAEDENVDVLVGTTNSDSMLRVINNVVRVNDIPLFVGTAATTEATADADKCHDLLFRTTETSGMTARAGAAFIADNPDINRVALAGEDYSFGRSIISLYRRALEEQGVEVVTPEGEELYPSGYADWQDEIQAMVDADADAVVYGFTTQTGTQFFQDFTTDAEGNTRILGMNMIGDMPTREAMLSIGENLLARVDELGEQFAGIDLGAALRLVNFGPLTTRYYWNQYDNEINTAFVDAQREAYSVNPDLFSSSNFATASAIVQAMDQAGEVSTDAIIEEVPGMTVQDTPKGEGEYDFMEENNQAFSPITLAELEESDRPDEAEPGSDDAYWPPVLKPTEPLFRVDKDEVRIDPANMTCDLTD